VAGRLVRLACSRHLADRRDGWRLRDLVWDPKAAQDAIDFFPAFLRLAEGAHAGRPFVLEPSQQFIVGSLFGWMDVDGYRRFRTAYIEEGKGNGKTPMAAGIGLYGLAADDEAASEIYAAAVTRDQAGILFRDAKRMSEASPSLRRRLEILEHGLYDATSGSIFRPLSSEARSLDGKRVHMALIDEIHEHPDGGVVDKMRLGTKGRRQPLILEITNSGYDRTSVCWAHHEYSRQVLEGLENDTWFAYVCQLDPCEAHAGGPPQENCVHCDQWTDERTWIKVNPLLGVSITHKYLREQVREAQGIPSKQAIVKRLNFCIWTETHTHWIPAEAWSACGDDASDVELLGMPCVGGVDLGQTDDFSAFLLVFALPDGRRALRCRFWLPEETVLVKTGRPYGVWRSSGHLTVTPGSATDYDQVQREILADCQRWGVRRVGYDNRFAEQMAQWLTGQGVTMVQVAQGYALNEALQYVERLVTGRWPEDGPIPVGPRPRLCHGGHPILAWMAGNAVVRHGTRGEIRLDKEKAAEKIDGIAALAMALDQDLRLSTSLSKYEHGNLLVL